MMTKEERREYGRKWYRENKKRHRDAHLRWRAKNKRWYGKALSSWESIIPKQTKCGVCGKDIFFNMRNARIAIHFDHRHGNCDKIKKPAHWLRDNRRTPEKETLWKSCDFGMLCENCNRCLPTKNRVVFLEKALKYAQVLPMRL